MVEERKADKAQLNKQQEADKGVHKAQTSGGGPVARRTCLRCGKLFDSIGRGNRLCNPSCRGSTSEEGKLGLRHSPETD